MCLNFLRIAFRQAIHQKEQTTIKIIGLAVGISVCLLIFVLVRFETSFDDFHPMRDHIYRVVSVFNTPQGIAYESGVPFPTAQALRRDYPQLKQVASILSLGGNGKITVPGNNKETRSDEKFREGSGIVYAEPQFFKMFAFRWLAGNKASALNEPNTVLLSKSIATKYFGSWTSAIGRSLKLDNNLLLKVTGVLEDVPVNTDFPLKIIISYATLRNTGVNGVLNNWTNIFAQYYCFVTLPDHLSEAAFDKDLTDMVNRYKPAENRNEGMRLLPLRDMHFDTRFNTFNNRPFSRGLIRTLSLIGLFVLVIACVNFVNLSTAQAILRSKEVGMRKVLGGTRRQLLWQFLGETCLLVLIATGVAAIFCRLTMPLLNRLLGIGLSVSFLTNPSMIALLFGVVIGTTFFAGFYPAMVLSGFDPVTAFKNRTAPKGSGSGLLRRVLVVLQFSISQALIICVLIILGQVDYFRSAPMGFDKDAILLTHMPDNSKMDFLRQQLMQQPGVEKVSFSFASPLDINSDWNSDIIYNGVRQHDFGANLKWADSVYPKLYNFQLLAGNIIPGPFNMVVNESFLRKLGIHQPEQALGAKVIVVETGDTSIISGVVRDFNIASLHDTIRPVIMEGWNQVYSVVNIKLSAPMIGQSMPAIEKLWKSTFPDDVYEYQFLDENIARLYEQEYQLSALYKIFACLAIFISCLGLYSLVSFMAATRVREVGIRKTLGGSVASIVYLFSREFTLLVLLAFLIAAPVAGYCMHLWLQNYAFHFEPGPLLFMEAIGGSIIVAWLSVGYRALRAALVNPVKSLRTE
jgi:putative ABC transport system permease protein